MGPDLEIKLRDPCTPASVPVCNHKAVASLLFLSLMYFMYFDVSHCLILTKDSLGHGGLCCPFQSSLSSSFVFQLFRECTAGVNLSAAILTWYQRTSVVEYVRQKALGDYVLILSESGICLNSSISQFLFLKSISYLHISAANSH